MTDGIDGTDAPVSEADDAARRRDEIVSRVTDHAGTMARELALLQGGDYGRRSFSTDDGEWTLKYEAGALQYLRFEGRAGGEIYVVSAHRPPDPEDLATAMADYEAFVAAFNDYVASLDGILDDAPTEFPEVRSAASVVERRDRVVERVAEVADAMAGELHRYDGAEYGEFTARVSGRRWTLKREGDRASYLRVGGSDGVYLLSQYGPASAPDVRDLAGEFGAFVEAFNERVDDLDADLSRVSL